MTPKAADTLGRLSRLVTYPGDGYGEDLDALVRSLADWNLDAARDLADFAARIQGLSIAPLQELFTRTFDLNPVCALEVGWHLFGEEYERGAFLVRMRQALREHGIDEGGELPDHLASLLLLVTKTNADEADLLVANALVPAVDKMLDPLEKSESPFLPLVKAIRQVLATCTPSGTRAERSGAMGSPRANAPAGVQRSPAMMSKDRSGAKGPPRATRLAGCRGPRHSSDEAIHA